VGQLLLPYSPLLGTAQSTSTANWQVVTTTTATGAGSPVRVRTNLSAQINVIGSAFGSLYFVNTLGWIDTRGKDG
jgi:hypothetical protein